MKIIGTAGSQEGVELVKSQGVDLVLNHREADYLERLRAAFPDGVDVILEMLANINLDNDMKLLKFRKGRVVVIGNRGTIEVIIKKIKKR
jgi:NADPH:quinone reductase